MAREFKVHFAPGDHRELCGTPGNQTANAPDITCRRCQFFFLAEQAPWARGFLDDLRKAGDIISAARAPRRAAKPFDGVIEGVGPATADTFREQSITQEQVRPVLGHGAGSVQVVMGDSGTPAAAVGVEHGPVTKTPGDAG